MSFKEITLKDIAGATSFTRTSIYNYFQTKEEIFLALMQKERERWVEELDAMASDYTTMSAESFASMLAHSLEKRSMLLKLLSMNHFDMEENSRPECLVDFKRAYGASIEDILDGLNRQVVAGKGVSMKDIVTLCHPRPTDEAQAALWKRLLENRLEMPMTWEPQLSTKDNNKQAWEELIDSGKVGYMAPPEQNRIAPTTIPGAWISGAGN
ncbi:MAG: TROVE domain-containing protein [Clostridia bacterium]|nr:TROVE domain-containing protein [Clostridia bacterium]